MAKISKTDDVWRKELTPQQFAILRGKATEAPYSSPYEYNADAGTYVCAACHTPLFDSGTKFDANCGWPSFYDAKPGAVEFRTDTSYGTIRTEVTCATCGGHLGHLFEKEGFDTPTDRRFCINGVSLDFQPRDQ